MKSRSKREDKMPAAAVLVIEDELFLREVLSDYLGQQGFKVSVADSGEQGLLLAQEWQFDVALVDLKLPGRDGLEIASQLKEIDPALRVIIMTGRPSLESAVAALRERVYDYLIKPFRLPDLRQVLQRAVTN